MSWSPGHDPLPDRELGLVDILEGTVADSATQWLSLVEVVAATLARPIPVHLEEGT